MRASVPGARVSNPHALPVRRADRRRARPPRAAFHGPRRPGVRAHEPAGDGEGRALRALLALPGHAAPAVPRRVRRLAAGVGRRLRRRGGQARGRALRADLRRLRRRQRRPARRRPRRLRVDEQHPHEDPPAPAARRLPRAEHPLHRLRRADARRRLPLLPRPGARPRVRAGDGLPVRVLLRRAADRARVGRRDLPPRRRGVGRRAPPRRQRQGLRPPARPAARRLAQPHGHLRHRPGLRAADPPPARPPAAGGAPLRRADPRRDQGRDAELRRARRAPRARRRVGPLPRAPARGGRALGRAPRTSTATTAPRTARP